MATRTWIGFTSNTFATTTNWLGGNVAVTGDDMIVNTALMTGAFYPTAMPVGAAVALNSLTIAVTGAVDAPAIFSTGTNSNITIGVGGLTATEATANKPTDNGFFIGSGTIAPKMLTGCVGSIATCAGKFGSGRWTRIDHALGATLTLTGVDQSGVVKYRGAWAGKTIIAAASSVLNSASLANVALGTGSELEYRATGPGAVLAPSGVISFPANFILKTYVPTAWNPTSGIGAGTVITADKEIGIYGGAAVSFGNAITINAYDTLSLVGGGYSNLTVNLFSQNPYTTILNTSTITVTGGTANLDYPAAVDVRFGTVTGGLTGTLRVPAAGDVREGTLVDAGVGTLAIGPVFLL